MEKLEEEEDNNEGEEDEEEYMTNFFVRMVSNVPKQVMVSGV